MSVVHMDRRTRVIKERAGMTQLEIQGDRIRRARDWVGLSQEDLAEKMGVETGEAISYATVSRIEKGKRGVFTHEMVALTKILGQSREWLEGNTEASFNEAMGVYRSWEQLELTA